VASRPVPLIAVTPKGVEHISAPVCSAHAGNPLIAVTPKGVEHQLCRLALAFREPALVIGA
jgi:hypothetical protein